LVIEHSPWDEETRRSLLIKERAGKEFEYKSRQLSSLQNVRHWAYKKVEYCERSINRQ